METFYLGEIKVSIERVDTFESKVYFENKLAFWISNEEKEIFINKLSKTIDEFKI